MSYFGDWEMSTGPSGFVELKQLNLGQTIIVMDTFVSQLCTLQTKKAGWNLGTRLGVSRP